MTTVPNQEQLIRLIEINAYGVYTGMLGNFSAFAKSLYERIKAPQIGDLVLEISTLRHASHDGNRLGQLLRDVREPVFTQVQIDEFAANGEDTTDPYFSQTERIVYIQTLDGREFRWHNADFIAVADDLGFFSTMD